VNSANRRPQINKDYKKRYSSSEMDKWEKIDKNIIIHGAGLSKPVTSSSSNGNEFGTNPSSAGNSSNSHARGNMMSSMDSDNLEDFSEYRGGSINERGNVFDVNENTATDTEINLINTSGSSLANHGHNSKMYHYSTFNYYNNHTLYHHGLGFGMNNSSSNHQPLPRIENSFPSRSLNSSKVSFSVLDLLVVCLKMPKKYRLNQNI
jgi:hypothetical protein